MNSAGGSDVIVAGQALRCPSLVHEFDGMAGVDEVPEDLVAHAGVTVTHAYQHRAVVVRVAQFLHHTPHIVRPVQLPGSLLTSVDGPHHARAWSRIDADYDPALTRALDGPSQCLGQIGLEVVCPKAGVAIHDFVYRGQDHFHVVRHGFAGFEVIWTVPTFSKQHQHPMHPGEISASHADAGHAPATGLRDLKHVLRP